MFSRLAVLRSRWLAHGASRSLRTVAVGAGMACSIAAALKVTDPHLEFGKFQASCGDDVEDPEYGLLSLEKSQALPVVVIRGVLTDAEIQEVLDATASDATGLGSLSRDANGLQQLHGPWTTHYLHTGGWFKSQFPALYDRFAQLVADTDARHWGLLAGAARVDRPVPRTIEIHSVLSQGALPDVHHFDSGSLWTLDIMLADPATDFTGGSFNTLEPDGHVLSHHFGRGDAVVFPSHKKHHVESVKSGWRRVLVIEYWHGEERTCAHRCLQRWGDCSYSAAMSVLDRMLRAAPVPGDPMWG